MFKPAFIIMLLLMGLATSVGTAWGLAVCRPVDNNVNRPDLISGFMRWDRAWYMVQVRQFGTTLHLWSDLAGSAPVEVRTSELLERHRAELKEVQRLGSAGYLFEIGHDAPRWGTFAEREAPPAHYLRGSDTSFGWPRRGLWHQVLSLKDPSTNALVSHELVGGVLVHGEVSREVTLFRALPLRPIYSGLAVNTLFFALLWAALIFGPGVVRRGMRRRRGACVACGYDLRGLRGRMCPECGAAWEDVEESGPREPVAGFGSPTG